MYRVVIAYLKTQLGEEKDISLRGNSKFGISFSATWWFLLNFSKLIVKGIVLMALLVSNIGR